MTTVEINESLIVFNLIEGETIHTLNLVIKIVFKLIRNNNLQSKENLFSRFLSEI